MKFYTVELAFHPHKTVNKMEYTAKLYNTFTVFM